MTGAQIYSALREKAVKTAKEIGQPSFYYKHRKELDESLSLLSHHGLLNKCRPYLENTKLHPAHGLTHCEKVAVEAGAIIRIEHSSYNFRNDDVDDLIICGQIAGLLHDIKRAEENHTVAGSLEAERILNDFVMEDRYKRYITAAIRNHEAFRHVLPSEDESAKLISDSLYDADKFRWGPDNFTTTLWLIMEATCTPAETLYNNFQEKMEGIRKIKDTFRTETGRKYGPEFIDAGIKIGDMIYEEISHIMGSK